MPELYSTNSVGLRFREVVKKIKERAKKKTNLKNLQNGQVKYGWKKTRVRANLWQNFKNIIIS